MTEYKSLAQTINESLNFRLCEGSSAVRAYRKYENKVPEAFVKMQNACNSDPDINFAVKYGLKGGHATDGRVFLKIKNPFGQATTQNIDTYNPRASVEEIIQLYYFDNDYEGS